ncbi:transmembrane protein 164 [Phymastichus coffea]|uniref:transmembrane protein 164 n=1 Tax=Phymastichus coffea TaxID=108790 RepID=UPI00273A8FEF|nr:transmembrane protein 164 [Phymastichus coffea]XP_058804721.1 transmembrane protein 164 [Phymastichus coffea]XP_058804722.1 transmembrane protein 164 [Phymastichus coffea]
MFEWAYSGVNASIPRNVGPECAAYLSKKRRIIETFLVSIYIIFLLIWSLKRMTLPKSVPYVQQIRKGKVFLLTTMCLVFGVEIGFKLSMKTFVYILNPCHVITIIEIYLLAVEPNSPTVTAIFRIVVSGLNGPVLAYVFPETDCRPMFADKAVYYIQHGLMAIVPYYLIRLGGAYNVEPLTDMSWSIFGYAVSLAYHFWILQIVGMLVQVNLSHMLCPAILDPFDGQNYRIWATCHQLLLIPLLYKLFCVSAYFFLIKCPLTRVKPTLDYMLINYTVKQKSINNYEVTNSGGNLHRHSE